MSACAGMTDDSRTPFLVIPAQAGIHEPGSGYAGLEQPHEFGISVTARMELGLPPVGRGQRPDGTGPYRTRPAGRRREDATGSVGH